MKLLSLSRTVTARPEIRLGFRNIYTGAAASFQSLGRPWYHVDPHSKDINPTFGIPPLHSRTHPKAVRTRLTRVLPFHTNTAEMPRTHAPTASDWATDGKEVDLLHYIFSRADLEALRGSPPKILAAIDEYCTTKQPLMNIGPHKGAFICELIATHKPTTMIELGGYVGYSAVLFGDAVRTHAGPAARYLSLELNPEMAAVANMLVELAGLRDVVTILVGPSDATLRRLFAPSSSSSFSIPYIEMAFIDHWQDRYLPDLWLLEELGALKPDVSVLVADNVIYPGTPDYLRWVRADPAQKRRMVEERRGGLPAAKKDAAAVDSDRLLGNPELVYESKLTEFEGMLFGDGRDGVEVTRLVGGEK